MKTIRTLHPVPAIAGLLLAVSPLALGHHSRAPFDLSRKVEMKARITDVRWSNPHVFLVGTVTDAQGRAEEWTFEGHSISGLVRAGWTRDTVRAGDELTLVVNPHRDAGKHFALMDHVFLPGGRKLYSVGVPPVDPAIPKAAVQPSKDFSGNWKVQFPGTPEQARARVLLGPAPPVKDGPYTPKAREQVARYAVDDNPALRCLPPTLPYLIATVYEYRWIRHADRIVIEKEQFNEGTRVIHLGDAKRPADYRPNPLGFSVGRFEPDGTLVVTTTGFSPEPWGNGTGIDSGPRKRITERYRLAPDGLGLTVSYTQEDPDYFTSPVSGEGRFVKMPDTGFVRNPPCDLGAAREHLKHDR
jgi:hypothetical protein